MRTLLDVSHVSRKGPSLRLTIPKKVADVLRVDHQGILGFYLDDNGEIVIQKMK
ncbi:MAG: hypothetical protein QXV22_02095 [Thermoplasmataceae archaeon]